MAGAGGTPSCGAEVAFKIVPGGPAGGTQFCTSAPNQCGGGSWVTVLDAEGHGVTTQTGCSWRDCRSCIASACPPYCGQSSLIPPAGLSTTWPAFRWVNDTCGENLACISPKCVEQGSYVARMCGYALAGTVGAGGTNGAAGAAGIPINPCEQSASKTPTCVDVPFEYPPSGVVTGVLDPRK